MTERDFRSLLEQAIGSDRIVAPEDAKGRPLSIAGDTMPGTILVRPKSTQELSAVMALCHAQRESVIPIGGATGLAGGLRSLDKEIYISLEAMNKIERIDSINRVAHVQAGVALQTLQEAATENGLSFPIDLGARGSATIGGMISTNAGGEKAFRFGMMREQVLGLEVVTAKGEVLDLSNTMLKNNTGYDLKHLFIGAEGTLGIVTRAQLRLRPELRNVNTAFALVKDVPSAIELRGRIEEQLGNDLTAFELMWPEFYEIVTAKRSGRLPLPKTNGMYLLFESEGGTARGPDEFENAMAHLFEEGHVEDMVVAASEGDRLDMWAIRNDIEALVHALTPLIAFDVSVPISSIDDFANVVENRVRETWPESRLVRFGHMGDNNLHIAITAGEDTMQNKTAICDLVYAEVTARNGSISAEHGIGADKRPWLETGKPGGTIALMQTLRQTFDPHGILNPGKTV